MKLFTDIETRRIAADDPRLAQLVAEATADVKAPANYKDQDKIDAYVAAKKAEIAAVIRDKTSFDPLYGTVAVIGLAVENEAVQSFAHPNEFDLLTDFFRVLTLYRDMHPTFVGHNIFWDLRFLLGRAAILGVQPPRFFVGSARAKPWGEGVIDTMTLWNPDRDKRTSLDALCRAMNIPSPKDGFSGKDVSPALEAGNIAKVVEYNAGDVRAVRALFARLMFDRPEA